MMLDVYSKALEKDFEKLTWLPAVIVIIKVIFYIVIGILIINYYISILRIKKETIKIRELLEDSLLITNDNEKED